MAAKSGHSTKKAPTKNRTGANSRTAKAGAPKKAAARKQAPCPGKRGLSAQTKAILLLAGAVLLLFLIFIPGENVWTFLHNVLLGLFGTLAIAWPFLLIYIAIITAMEKKVDAKMAGKLSLAIGVIIFASSLVYIWNSVSASGNYFSELGALYTAGTGAAGAGLLSGVLGIPMLLLFGKTGAEILCILALLLCVMFLFGITLKHIFQFLKKPADKVAESVNSAREHSKRRRAEQNRRQEQSAVPPLFERPDFESGAFSVPDITMNGKKHKKTQSGKIDIPIDGSVSKPPEDIDNKRKRLETLLQQTNVHSAAQDAQATEAPMATFAAKKVMEKKRTPRKSDPQQLQPDPQTVPFDIDLPEDDRKRPRENEKGYRFPPVDLLHPNFSSEDSDAFNELQENGQKLVSTLNSFGVQASIINICRGPSVTRFELQPAAGVKISKITNLADDIALNLAANGVRIEAPIPGKAAIGIEVPNKTISMVTMRELIDSKEFKREKSRLTVVLGRDISGNIVVTDLAKMPHLLIAGTTGSGKSVCVNSILLSLLYKGSPDEVRLVLIDPKMVEFSKYKGLPHLLIPVVSDVKKAAGALNWAVSEMLERYKTFAAYNVRDIHAYNSMIERYRKRYANIPADTPREDKPLTDDGLPIPDEPMPQIVIAIDELADLMMAAPNEVEESICRLAQMARAAGMHLVIATQRPSVNVITGVIKANIPSRIALKTSSQVDSRTILDFGGAEKLIGKGDMLFSPVGAPKPLRVQGCYASDEEIENVTGFIKKSYKSEYDESVVEQIEKIASQDLSAAGKDSATSGTADEDRDPMLEEAIKLVVEAGQASTSLLQRRLRLGYARAGRLIDEMEQMGIVGPHEGSKSRQVLMTHQQWLERNNLIGD